MASTADPGLHQFINASELLGTSDEDHHDHLRTLVDDESETVSPLDGDPPLDIWPDLPCDTSHEATAATVSCTISTPGSPHGSFEILPDPASQQRQYHLRLPQPAGCLASHQQLLSGGVAAWPQLQQQQPALGGHYPAADPSSTLAVGTDWGMYAAPTAESLTALQACTSNSLGLLEPQQDQQALYQQPWLLSQLGPQLHSATASYQDTSMGLDATSHHNALLQLSNIVPQLGNSVPQVGNSLLRNSSEPPELSQVLPQLSGDPGSVLPQFENELSRLSASRQLLAAQQGLSGLPIDIDASQLLPNHETAPLLQQQQQPTMQQQQQLAAHLNSWSLDLVSQTTVLQDDAEPLPAFEQQQQQQHPSIASLQLPQGGFTALLHSPAAAAAVAPALTGAEGARQHSQQPVAAAAAAVNAHPAINQHDNLGSKPGVSQQQQQQGCSNGNSSTDSKQQPYKSRCKVKPKVLSKAEYDRKMLQADDPLTVRPEVYLTFPREMLGTSITGKSESTSTATADAIAGTGNGSNSAKRGYGKGQGTVAKVVGEFMKQRTLRAVRCVNLEHQFKIWKELSQQGADTAAGAIPQANQAMAPTACGAAGQSSVLRADVTVTAVSSGYPAQRTAEPAMQCTPAAAAAPEEAEAPAAQAAGAVDRAGLPYQTPDDLANAVVDVFLSDDTYHQRVAAKLAKEGVCKQPLALVHGPAGGTAGGGKRKGSSKVNASGPSQEAQIQQQQNLQQEADEEQRCAREAGQRAKLEEQQAKEWAQLVRKSSSLDEAVAIAEVAVRVAELQHMQLHPATLEAAKHGKDVAAAVRRFEAQKLRKAQAFTVEYEQLYERFAAELAQLQQQQQPASAQQQAGSHMRSAQVTVDQPAKQHHLAGQQSLQEGCHGPSKSCIADQVTPSGHAIVDPTAPVLTATSRDMQHHVQLECISDAQCTIVRVPAVKRGILRGKQQPEQVILPGTMLCEHTYSSSSSNSSPGCRNSTEPLQPQQHGPTDVGQGAAPATDQLQVARFVPPHQKQQEVTRLPSIGAVPADHPVLTSIATALKYFKAVAAGVAAHEYAALAAPPVAVLNHSSAAALGAGDAAVQTAPAAAKESTGSRHCAAPDSTSQKQHAGQQQRSMAPAVRMAAAASKPQRRRMRPAAYADCEDVDQALEHLGLVEVAAPAEAAAVGDHPAAIGGTASERAVAQAGVPLAKAAVAEVEPCVGASCDDCSDDDDDDDGVSDIDVDIGLASRCFKVKSRPRGAGNGRARGAGKGKAPGAETGKAPGAGQGKVALITMDSLRKVFHMPMKAAASKLGICQTVMKSHCRKLKINRWPHRKRKSIGDLMEKVRQYGIRSGRVQEANEVCQQLQGMLDEQLIDPNKDLDSRVMNLRQAIFKQEYKARKSQAKCLQPDDAAAMDTDFADLDQLDADDMM